MEKEEKSMEKIFASTEIPTLENPNDRENEKVEIVKEGGL